MSAARAPLSAVVTTYNNAATLDRCLASLAFCDEIVVLDSDSTDATREIARRHGARVDIEPFKGYGPQKQSAIGRARHDWVLLLDADEHLSDAGREAIEGRPGEEGQIGRNERQHAGAQEGDQPAQKRRRQGNIGHPALLAKALWRRKRRHGRMAET